MQFLHQEIFYVELYFNEISVTQMIIDFIALLPYSALHQVMGYVYLVSLYKKEKL